MMTRNKRQSRRSDPGLIPKSSVYPLHPDGTKVILRISETELTTWDRVAVAGSSLFIVGAVVWVPLLYSWALSKWKRIPKTQKRRKLIYGTIMLSCVAMATCGPHRSVRFGQWLRMRHWNLWKSWFRFVAMEVMTDQPAKAYKASPPSSISTTISTKSRGLDHRHDQALFAFVPHGIVPFSLGFAAMPALSQQAFGVFRMVVASATSLVPVLRDLIRWADSVDASRSAVDAAMQQGTRLGLVPGGIAEMFEGYPKPMTRPDEEYAIVRRGFLRMAAKHRIPVIPVYCFGATKMFRRLQLPLLEQLSLLLRISICVFYGVLGLPIPFRQKLLYVIGQPIYPPEHENNHQIDASAALDQQVDHMYEQFCDELIRIFDRHKEAYGWGHKVLKLLSR